jgi:hypothetical protein
MWITARLVLRQPFLAFQGGGWHYRATIVANPRMPLATVSGRLRVGTVLAVLALLVHSGHTHASGSVHVSDEPAAAEFMHMPAAVPTGQLIHGDLPMAVCMMLELAGSRLETLVLATAAVGLVLMFLVWLPPHLPMRDAIITPRPPPGARRQALLGVFST